MELDLFGSKIIKEHIPQNKNESFAMKRRSNKIFDYYATPPIITHKLLEKEKLYGEIWEPACGEGHISSVLIEYGYSVFSSDLIDRGFGEKIDFLKSEKMADTIITNPPYNLIDKFLYKAKQQTRKKIIFIASSNFLRGKSRISRIVHDKDFPLKKVYILSINLNYYVNGKPGKNKTGFLMTSILVFDKEHKGDALFDWIII